jgi:hypothetical protein
LVLLAPSAAVAADGLQVRIDDLRATIRDQQTRVETTETRTERSVAMPSDVLFAFDSAQLSRSGVRALRAAPATPGSRSASCAEGTRPRSHRGCSSARHACPIVYLDELPGGERRTG